MLNKKRVITMAKLAMYEKGEKKEYLRISTYHRWDYISFNVIMSMIWATVGYILIAAAWAVSNYAEILSDISIEHMRELAMLLGGMWLVVLLVFGVMSGIFYYEKYYQAEQETKYYYRMMKVLNKIYEKEK